MQGRHHPSNLTQAIRYPLHAFLASLAKKEAARSRARLHLLIGNLQPLEGKGSPHLGKSCQNRVNPNHLALRLIPFPW